MLPTEIPFSFPFWKIIMIMSTADDNSNHSEIIKAINAQRKNYEAIGKWCFFFQYVKMNETKHTKMLISGAFGNFSD